MKNLAPLAAIVAFAGVSASVQAETYFIYTMDAGQTSIVINGVPAVYTQTSAYGQLTVWGDLVLNAADRIFINGDRPARIVVLNNCFIAQGAVIDTFGSGGGSGGLGSHFSESNNIGYGSAGGIGGLGGARGLGGAGGVLGSGGVNGFSSTLSIGGTASIAPFVNANSGEPGTGAFGGFGGGGAAGETANSFSDRGDGGAGVSNVAGGAGGSAGGGDGANGRTGRQGSDAPLGAPGVDGQGGGFGTNGGSGFDLCGGGGGGGGSIGGGGAGGGGGGGGSGGGGGGGGGSAGILSTGGLGGAGSRGANGGQGGEGGKAAEGTQGGDGGGAVEIFVLGRALINGYIDAGGDNSAQADLGDLGEPGGFGPQPGAPGNGGSGLGAGSGMGGMGGRGGVGGRGGQGGPGGTGGTGGEGGGGTVIISASVIDAASTGNFYVRGGQFGGASTHPNADGRVGVRDNVVGESVPFSIPFGTVVTTPSLAVRSTNPYTNTSTPLVPDFVDGAEVFGLATLTPEDFPAVVAGAPLGAKMALVRSDIGPGPYAHDFIDYDFLAVINLSTSTIDSVQLHVNGFGGPLQVRGTLPRAVGAPGMDLPGLDAGRVWATLVADNEDFPMELSSQIGVASTPGLGVGEVIYIGSCPADLNADGILNFFDVSAFLNLFGAQDPGADLAAPFGEWNFFDVSAFLSAFANGCPA